MYNRKIIDKKFLPTLATKNKISLGKKKKQGVCHNPSLAIYIKKRYLKAKEEL
jgi:hypothetical protein